MSDKLSWKPLLTMYRCKAALKFNDCQFDKVLDVLDSDDFYDMPFALLGGKTIMVPAEAVQPLKEEGLEFVEQAVITPDEATPEELERMRRECFFS